VKELSHKDRQEVFNQVGIKNPKRNPRYNIHHIIFKSDVSRGLVDKHFPLCNRSNLIPLPIETHNALHKLVEETPDFRNNIESRVWLANYAYNSELDLL
jgi:hypothetical protein